MLTRRRVVYALISRCFSFVSKSRFDEADDFGPFETDIATTVPTTHTIQLHQRLGRVTSTLAVGDYPLLVLLQRPQQQ